MEATQSPLADELPPILRSNHREPVAIEAGQTDRHPFCGKDQALRLDYKINKVSFPQKPPLPSWRSAAAG